MTPAQLLRILFARRWTIVATFVLAMVAATSVAIVLPKRYVATASVVVNGRSEDPLRASTAGPGSGPSVVTQIDIIKRTRVAQRVVADLSLTKDESWQAGWREATDGQGDFASWIASAIAGGLTVAAGGDSNVVDLQYKSEDPKFAATMASAFADAYLETMLDLRTVPAGQYAGFFDERIRVARDRLGDAQRKLSSFEKTNDIVGGGGRVDVESARLGDLSSQLATAQAQAADAASRHAGATSVGATSPEVLQFPIVQDLRAKIAAEEVKLKEMATRVTPAYPAYISEQTEIAELKNRLSVETSQIVNSLATAQRIGTSRVAEIQTALNAQRQRVLSLQALRDQDEVLRKEAESAQGTFDLLMQRQSQSMLESLARQSDASLLDHASVPAKPTSPKVPLILLLGAIGGLVAGMLIALVIEYFRPVLRSIEDLVDRTGLPVLTIVPDAGRRRGRLTRSAHRVRPALMH